MRSVVIDGELGVGNSHMPWIPKRIINNALAIVLSQTDKFNHFCL